MTPLGIAKTVTISGVSMKSSHFYYKVEIFGGEKTVTISSVAVTSVNSVSGEPCNNVTILEGGDFV